MKKNLKLMDIMTTPTWKSDQHALQESMEEAWQKIAPMWPLKNIIAVNPLQGWEDLPIEQALVEGHRFFQQKDWPKAMEAINRQTIKWCQSFFDQGQSTLSMPLRHQGLYQSWRQLARFDQQLHHNDKKMKDWLNGLPESPESVILDCLHLLDIPSHQYTSFFQLLLCSLPGWAAYIKYCTEWTGSEPYDGYPVTQTDYLALRLVIMTCLWPEASKLLSWYEQIKSRPCPYSPSLEDILKREENYRRSLLSQLRLKAKHVSQPSHTPLAQIVFCIDVRSEPFRRALEQQGNYETLGFAGFFGLPIRIQNELTGESYASCPVLITPKHTVRETQLCFMQKDPFLNATKLKSLKRLYQSLKYTFTTPFTLVETLGFWSGIWMGMRTFFPRITNKLQTRIRPASHSHSSSLILEDIPLANQYLYAEKALRMMGLTKNFAPLVVFCGHGSSSTNNAYASALDCGACGGRPGGTNARILAEILNSDLVRQNLKNKGIIIPNQTHFIAAEHNTTTDEVILFPLNKKDSPLEDEIKILKEDLEKARKANCQWRAKEMNYLGEEESCKAHAFDKSIDWSQVRPEWGLARNASFIVGPRNLTQDVNLQGRSFLHSYDWQQDPQGELLTTILTAPMVVAQWINSQYFFSSMDNIAFGSGSKITHNITGKIAIMQGNASDLMHGLSLQSVFKNDQERYHQPQRLLTIVYAPHSTILSIILRQEILKKLFKNGWVSLVSIDPIDGNSYLLARDLTWKKI